jgi:hypothetical protein
MEEFFKQWETQLNKVSHILQYLHTYSDRLVDLDIPDLITPAELYKQQEAWVKLYSKYTGMEQEFFKPYWIPVQRTFYDNFIDMSDSNFPLFEAYFGSIGAETDYWDKLILFKSITNLMLVVENDKINLKNYRSLKFREKFGKYLWPD